MTLHTSNSCPAGTLLLRAGLLVLLLIGFSHPTALRAAPIVLTAATLSSTGCDSTVSGDDFSFTGTFGMAGCGGRLAPVGIGGQDLIGTLDVPENPGRYAIAYGPYQPSLFKYVTPEYVPDNFTGLIDVNVVLSGSLQVCLAHEGVSFPAGVSYYGCDPQYVDFGVININVAGLASFYAYDGVIGARDFLGFSGTSAAAPEPSYFAAAGSAALLLFALIRKAAKSRSRTSLGF